jgi:autoinducer 2-degrading protein
MYVVAAQFYAREGKDDEVAAILKKMIPISRAEAGCAFYTVNRSVEDPRKFLLYEQYHEKSDFEAHTATEPFKEHVLGKVIPLLETRVRTIYDLVEP